MSEMMQTEEEDDIASSAGEEGMEGSIDDTDTMLKNLGMAIAQKRSHAIDGRSQSGIEEEWLEDEEHYEGVDDTNRGESKAWRTKPMGQAALGGDRPDGSTIFFNVTRPYVDAADARVGDMLLPSNEKGWSIKPTPVPDLIQIAGGEVPKKVQNQIDSEFQNQVDTGRFDDQEDPIQAGAEKAVQVRDQLVSQVQEELKESKKKADGAEKQIEDWHIECNYTAQMRLVVADAAKIGCGVLKGPLPKKTKSVAFVKDELLVQEKISPVSVRVDPWQLFPDPACGEDIHTGGFIFERDLLVAKSLSELRGNPGYLDEQIEKVLMEGPAIAVKQFQAGEGSHAPFNGLSESSSRDGLFEIWYFYGRLEREDIALAGFEVGEEYADVVDICVTMVNNHIIRLMPNHLETGEFPYDVMVWQRRQGTCWGIGISRQLRSAQRVVNGAARNMMDNAGLAGGPMWMYQQGLVTPMDGVMELAPRKGWMAAEDADLNHIDNAFRFITIPMVQQELQAIITMGLKMAEDVSGMPLIMQGQQGSAPETVGGMQLLHNNASTVMRRIARLFDDLITEPHIRRYYRYLLQHGEDWEIKGDFEIHAKGSSALLERDAQNQFIQQMGELVMNPVFGLDPKKWMAQQLTQQRLDIEKFQYDDPEWQKVVEQMSQPPSDPAVEVANIRGEVAKMEKQLDVQVDERRMQFEAEEARKKMEFEAAMKQIDTAIVQAKEDGLTEREAEKIRAGIAEVVMKLTTQKELAGAGGQTIRPATEVPGRAPPGRAFEA
jgi:tellurite resistance protein